MTRPRYRRGREAQRHEQIDSLITGSFISIILVSGLGMLAILLRVIGVLP